jgi:hypothetical protein
MVGNCPVSKSLSHLSLFSRSPLDDEARLASSPDLGNPFLPLGVVLPILARGGGFSHLGLKHLVIDAKSLLTRLVLTRQPCFDVVDGGLEAFHFLPDKIQKFLSRRI